jgi:AraC-like DNA-binding protein
MQMQFFHIREALEPYIKMICMLSCDTPGELLPFRVLPDTCVELFITCNGQQIAEVTDNTSQERKMSFASFRMRSFMDVRMQQGYHCIAVCFYPGAAYRFFSLSMQELSDSATELSYLWKRTAAEMEEKIAGTATDQGRVDIVQTYLQRQFMQQAEVDGRIAHSTQIANDMKGLLSVRRLADESHISERQLHRRFMRYLGISPKEYLSMNRFLHSLVQLKKQPVSSLTDIAYESGYYDQAHFNHEYGVFAGLSPGEVLMRDNIIY